MLRRVFTAVMLALAGSTAAVCADFEFGQSSISQLCQEHTRTVSTGVLSETLCETTLHLFDKDNGDMYTCIAGVGFIFLSGAFQNESIPRKASCRKVFSLPTPARIDSRKEFPIPDITFRAGWTFGKPPFGYWHTDKAGNVSVCILLNYAGLPPATFPPGPSGVGALVCLDAPLS
jgi:hypothetical protein